LVWFKRDLRVREVHIPAGTHAPGGSPAHAIWKFNGAVRVRSRIHSDGA
jgi:hypothetical protein